ncbi:MAG: RnfABCDGE type electron transport complex subunit G [Clostridia bacterium]|nr:RnfABCDGE type electron transport complex subunit G [Clostridia bacterium]
MQRKDIFEIAKIGLILFAITAISAGILATVNGVTAPIISSNAKAKRESAMSKVLPEAVAFEPVEYNDENSSVIEAYSAGDAGYVILCEPRGYAGEISIVVGVKPDLTVNSIDITSQSETPGLGANCTNSEFIDAFRGKSKDIKVVKSNPSGNQVDALSSATVTTKAVTRGVNDALKAAEELIGGDK